MATKKPIGNAATLAGTVLRTEKIRLTKWTASQPVTKKLRLAGDGSVEKISTANQLHEGKITRIECTPESFIDVLKKIGPNDCLSYALPVDPTVSRVVSRSKYQASGKPSDTTTRTAEKMAWPDGPAIFMGDYDPRDDLVYSREELCEQVYKCCPAMRDAAHIWSASASSCLINKKTKKEVCGIRGQRLYIVVVDGTDIPRAGAVFCKRSWLNGQGYIQISKSGAMLERSLLDGAVFQPNRIDYCAPPVCEPPLKSRKPIPTLMGNPNLALDTRIALPDLTPDEEAEYKRLVAAAKAAKRVEAESVRETYKKGRVEDLVKNGLDPDAAERVITQALDGCVLLADFRLTTEDGQTVSVGEILRDKARWHRTRFADPIEPEYHGDNRIATAFLDGPGRPHIYSYAHGGCHYRLSHNVLTIRLQRGERAPYMDQITGSFLDAGEFYRRGEKLVSISDDGAMAIQSSFQILKAMDQQFRFEKYERKNWVPADASLEMAKMFGDAYVTRFPKLKAVLSAPIIVPETGRLISKSGYDIGTGAYVHIDGDVFYIPEEPNMAEIREALCELWWAVRLFPFATELDETVMLTALLTAVLRPLLPTAPGFAFDAPIQASGKTLLIKVLAALSGSPPKISPQPNGRNDEEMRKRLFAELLGGHNVIVIDNIVGEFDSPSLAALLTSEEYSDRVLKESRTETVPSNALLLLSGNNLILKGDLPRRILRCRIDPNVEQPHQRQFDFDPVAVVRADRQRIVAAALTLFKGYLANKPSTQIGPGRMASFEAWDEIVRQTVCWLAELQPASSLPVGITPEGDYFPRLVDPMEAIDNAVREDPARSQHGRLLNAWADEIGTGEGLKILAKNLVGKGEATFQKRRPGEIGAAIDDLTLRDVLIEMAGNPVTGLVNTGKLGKTLAKYKDRIVDGLCLRQGSLLQRASTWWVEDMRELGEFGELNSTDLGKKKIKTPVETKENRPTELTKLTVPLAAQSQEVKPRKKRAG